MSKRPALIPGKPSGKARTYCDSSFRLSQSFAHFPYLAERILDPGVYGSARKGCNLPWVRRNATCSQGSDRFLVVQKDRAFRDGPRCLGGWTRLCHIGR